MVALFEDPRVGELVDSQEECVVWGLTVDAKTGKLYAIIGEIVADGWHGATVREVPANEVIVYAGRKTL
jgi:hypothetical protein